MEDAYEFTMEGPPTPLHYLLPLPAHTHMEQREDEREMTEVDRGQSTSGLHVALLVTGWVACCCTDEAKVQIYHLNKFKEFYKNKQATKRKIMYGYQAQLIYIGLVRVSGIDYIISVNSIFISTRMTGQEV